MDAAKIASPFFLIIDSHSPHEGKRKGPVLSLAEHDQHVHDRAKKEPKNDFSRVRTGDLLRNP